MSETILKAGTQAQIAETVLPSNEMVQSTGDGSLYVHNGLLQGGAWRWAATPATALPENAPSSGATIITTQGERMLALDPAATIASLTVTLPSSPVDRDEFEILTSAAITTLTVNAPAGATVKSGTVGMSANTGASWRYRAANATWYRRF